MTDINTSTISTLSQLVSIFEDEQKRYKSAADLEKNEASKTVLSLISEEKAQLVSKLRQQIMTLNGPSEEDLDEPGSATDGAPD